MASVKQMVNKRIEQIEAVVEELRGQVDEGEFDQMMATTDKLAEQADQLSGKLEKVAASLKEEEDEEQEEGEGETADKNAKKRK